MENEQYEFMVSLFENRVAYEPEVTQHWATLAYLEYKTGDKEGAIAALEQATEINPGFTTTAQCFITNIEAGADPQTGC